MNKITTERHYKITLTGGSTYYGRTTLLGNKRWNIHTFDLRRGKHPCLQEVYDKYGYDDWVHEWLGWETGDLQHHRQIEFGYVQADPKSINIRKGYYLLLSEEEKKEYNYQKTLNETPEQREERLSPIRTRSNTIRWSMTPEELKEHRRKGKEDSQRKRDNETSKQREERLIKEQQKRDNKTPEEYEQYRRRDREYYRRSKEKKRSGDNK